MKGANFRDKRTNRFVLATLAATLVLLSAASCGDDGSSATVDGGSAIDAGPQESADFVFDESQIRTFNVTLPAAAWDNLQATATDEQYTTATLEYEGQTVENIGLRFKGDIGSLYICFIGGVQICDKLSMKLKFNEYVPGQRFYGLKKINLHAMESDPSKMHDAIGYKLFRDQNVYAPRTAYARLLVNGESLGLFIAVEAIDGRFTRSRFPDGGKGNLYKEVWPMHTTEGPYIAALKTNEDESPSADKMVRFTQDLNAAGDAGFVDTLRAWTDVDMLMRYMAVDRLIDHWDGIVAWYCSGSDCSNHNFYWYESSTEDKVWLVPWDLDHTFEEPSPIRSNFGMPDWDAVNPDCGPVSLFAGFEGRAPSCDPLIGRMARLLWTEYKAATEVLLAGDFASAAMNARIDALAALIASEVEADTVSTQTSTEWQAAVQQLKNAVDAKRSYVQSKL
jgi:spore coat protein CotH